MAPRLVQPPRDSGRRGQRHPIAGTSATICQATTPRPGRRGRTTPPRGRYGKNAGQTRGNPQPDPDSRGAESTDYTVTGTGAHAQAPRTQDIVEPPRGTHGGGVDDEPGASSWFSPKFPSG